MSAIFFVGCNESKQGKTLGETEYYFDDQLSSISSDGDSAYWIGSETGDIWHINKYSRDAYHIGTDRIYDVVADRNTAQQTFCWIGVRNSGLQKWKFDKNGFSRMAIYNISHKADKYSPYDIELCNKNVYVATSQGLYTTSRLKDECELQRIYPSDSSLTAKSGAPFLVSNLCKYNDNLIFASTQNGLVRVNCKTSALTLLHKGVNIHYVAVYGNKIYALADKILYIEDTNGKNIKETSLNFSSRVYYKVGNTHYFIGTSDVILSEDLKKFVTIPLRREVPEGSHNIILSDKENGFSLMITKNALWRIPFHLGIFNGDNPTVAACSDGDYIYYVNSANELFRQHRLNHMASKIYSFPKEEQVRNIYVSGNKLYYVNNNQKLKSLSIRNSYLQNKLFSHSTIIYQSRTKITASCLKTIDNKPQIFLGVQDEMVIIDSDNRVENIAQLNNKYVTSFYKPKHSDIIYLSTLNDGVYYGKEKDFKRIEHTENNPFIRDLIVNNDYNHGLIMLTNHKLILQNSDDTLNVKGFNKLLYVNDTLFYALPEFGIRKYLVSNGKIREAGRYYADISFTPEASFVSNGTLYLGSNIGVMMLTVNRENNPKWVDFNTKVPNLPFISLIALFIIILVIIIVYAYIKRKSDSKKQMLLRIEDLKRRFDGLAAMCELLDADEKKEEEILKKEIDDIDINTTGNRDINALIIKLSADIMKKNRNIALQLSKQLEKQMKRIEETSAYDRDKLLNESHDTCESDKIEIIRSQVDKNEIWLNHISVLTDCLKQYSEMTKDCLEIEGVNDTINERIANMTDEICHRPLSELYDDFTRLKCDYEYIFSEDALDKIKKHIIRCRKFLEQNTVPDKVVNSLINKIDSIAADMESKERLLLLKELKPIDNRVKEFDIKNKISVCINEYTRTRNSVICENDKKVNKKFDISLESEITDQASSVVNNIEKLINSFYQYICETDKDVIINILKFTNSGNQQVKVAVLLMVDPKVKRVLLPGLLGIYGNLNPVISRLINNKIKTNEAQLQTYVNNNSSSLIYYLLKLSE